MNAIIDFALTKIRTVLSVLVLILIAGWMSFLNIPRESSPDVKIPIIFVSVHYEGISPEDSERLILRPLEQKIRTLEGLEQVTGTAYENGGTLVVEFVAGFNVDKALTNVREQVDLAKPDIPQEADEPVIKELSFSQFPILVIKLSGAIPERSLFKMAEDLKHKIEADVSGVLQANIVGDREEVVEILIDPVKMETYNISFASVIQLLQRNNLVVSAGNLESKNGQFAIKVPGLLETPEDIMSLPVVVNGDAVVTFGDFVDVRKTYKDALTLARDRGVPAVAIEVSKRAGENILETNAEVRDVVEKMRKGWPAQVNVAYAQDQTHRIRDMLADLQDNLIFACLLVMIVMVATLGWRSALLVGIAIPGSFLAGILFIDLMGYTLNIVVIFSLILAVGMLVDGAIIVVEYADRKMMEGEGRLEAFRLAAKRMTWPVITSTVTILVAFAPLLFWPGTVGQFMRFIPITLLVTLTASIAMALIFIPALGAVFGAVSPDASEEHRQRIHTSESGDVRAIGGFTGMYVNVLDHLLDYPKRVVFGALGVLAFVITLYGLFGKGTEFFPNLEPDQAKIEVHARGNLSLAEKDQILRQVEQRILPLKELKSVYTRVGSTSGQGPSKGGAAGEAEDVIGVITLEFVDWQERRKAVAILKDIENRTKDIAGVKIELRQDKPGPSQGKPIELNVQTDNKADLVPTVAKMRQYMESQSGIVDVEDNRPTPGIRWAIHINRAQAAKFGADVALLGAGLRLVTNGFLVGKYRPDDAQDEVDIVLRFPPNNRNLNQLDLTKIRTEKGLVPVSNFMTRTPEPKVSVIYRSDGSQVMTLKADVREGVLVNDKIAELKTWIEAQNFKPGIEIKFKGQEKDQNQSKVFLIKSFGIAIFAIAIILITQFNNFFSAGLVLSSIIMSTIGVFIGLLFRGMPFGIVMCGIGVIALAGIIVSNNIILIDTFDRLRVGAQDMKEVVLRTGAQRLRPVILTKLTTILGLLPIFLALNINFLGREITYGAPATQWWIQLATCIVSGVFFASSLTLIVTPSALMWRENYRARKTASKNPVKKKGQTGKPGPRKR